MDQLSPLPEFDRGQAALKALRDKVIEALSNPRQTLKNVGQGILDKHKAHQALDKQAFADPKDPFRVTDKAALGQLGDNAMMLNGFAPAGILAGLSAKTLPGKDLIEASQMARKGADPAEIWWKTGFGKGPDGQWRFEIDDSQIKPVVRGAHTQYSDPLAPISQSIPFPELYKAYPRLGNHMLNAELSPLHSSPSGSYHAGPRTAGFAGGQIHAKAPTEDSLSSTVLHELQHGVQKQQAWQGGGNPGMFMRQYAAPGADPAAKMDAFRKYIRLQGEAEARLVESRRKLNPEERRLNFPYDPVQFQGATGVPITELIDQPTLARMMTQTWGPKR